MNLILFGFKGCGKTYFGKRLAEKMHRPFIDTDDLIVDLYKDKRGETLPFKEIYKEIGEEEFRALEKKAIQGLIGTQNSVIAVGGGAVLDSENVKLLQKIGALVYLKASQDLLKKRLLIDELPAFFDQKAPYESFLKMVHERTPIYESIPAERLDLNILDEAGTIAALRSILILEDPPNGF